MGSPESTMEAESAVKLFVLVIEAGGIPLALQGGNPQAPLVIVEESVTNAYAQHTVPEGQELPAHMQPKKKQKYSDWEEDSGADAWGGKGSGGKGFGGKGFGGKGWGDMSG